MKKKEDFLTSEIEKELNPTETNETEVEEKVEDIKKENKLKAILHSRKFARGWLSIAIVAIFLVCIIAVNIIASVLQSKFPSLAFDLTSSNLYELQDDTVKFVKDIDTDIKICVLTTEDNFKSLDSAYIGSDYQPVKYFSQANQFLKKMESLNSHISVDYVDISSNPSFATTYKDLDLNNTGAGTMMIVDAGSDNYKGLSFTDLFERKSDESAGYSYIDASNVEQALCTSILSLTQTNPANACFITSSGIGSESDSQTGSSTFTALKKLLKNQAYNTTEVDLDTNKNIPDNCDILFLVAPTRDLSETAMEKVEAFLEKAKKTNKTFVYVPNPFKIQDGTPNLDIFLEKQGITIGEEWVYEQNNSYLSSIYPNDHRLSILDYSNDEYTSGVDVTSKVLAGDSRPISFTEGSNAISLLETSKDADILPLDAESEEDVKEGNGEPMSVTALSQSEVSTGIYKNVLVISSFYAISDEFLNGYPQYNNSNYFTNVFNTLTENEGQTVAIKSAKKSDTSLNLESSSQTVAPMIIFIFVIPIGVIVVGIVVWARRRKK